MELWNRLKEKMLEHPMQLVGEEDRSLSFRELVVRT